MTEDKTVTEILRGQFPADYVGKLPRITCQNCSRGNCNDHSKGKCQVCGNYISERHIHLDYVGHADVTIRLLDADPEWSWQPKATDPDPELLKAAVASGNPEIVSAVIENAPPKFETDKTGNPVGLWIRLTVGGVTRLGYGSCPGNQNDAEKVLIGDALRNAAMRFGVAVELWAKGDRADPTAENATASGGQAVRGRQSAADAFESATPSPPRQAGNGQPRGQVSRPAQPQITAQPAGENDPDAQAFADQAHEARTLGELEDIHKRAREAGKVAAVIRNPSTGKTGKLAVFIDWRRKTVAEADAALTELNDAARARDMDITALEAHVKQVTGADIESATAAQLREAARALVMASAA